MTRQALVALADAWGPRHGGVNAFNHDLCGGLASRLSGSVPVICIVPRASEEERRAASTAGIILLCTQASALDSGDIRRVLEQVGYEGAAWWIGHDVITGPLALNVMSQLGGKTALIHHMSYAAYAAYKHGQGIIAVERRDEQRALFDQADQTFAVGPVLRDSLLELLDDDRPRPRMLIPGLPRIQARNPPRAFKAIVVGRLGPEDDRIKQGRLAVAGVAAARRRANQTPGSPVMLTDQRPNIYVVGIDAAGGETEKSLQQLSETQGGDVWPHVVAQPFIENRDALFRELASAHVALMPSWHEGFGLTGWEAIAAGVPLIVSKESGLYRLVKELLPGLENCLMPVTVGGHVAREGEENFSDEDVGRIADAVLTVAGDWEEAKKRAGTLRHLLEGKSIRWDATAEEFLGGLGVNDFQLHPVVSHQPASATAVITALIDPRSPLGEGTDFPDTLLLRPESQIVPFQSVLEPACADIVFWTLDEAAFPQRVALRLYTAEGGSGKTRLLIEACSRLLDRPENDWIAGFIVHDIGATQLAQGISTLFDRNPRAFVVIDYAETRRPDVRTVVSAALRAPANHRVRIVLLGRGEGDWWDLLRHEERADQDLKHFLASLNGTQGPFALPGPKADELATRQEIFEGARKAFAARLGIEANAQPPPNLRAAHFAQMLFMHLAALASLHGHPLEEEGALLDAALDRERDYWVRGLVSEGLGEDLLEGLAQSVAMFTLIDGVRTAKEAKEILAVTPRLRAAPQGTRDKLFDMLRRLYPREGGIDALRPNLLGERHARACIARDQEVMEEVLDTDRHPAWTGPALTVLSRIAKSGEDRWLRRALREDDLKIPLVERAVEVTIEVGDPLGLILADVMGAAGKKYQGIINHIAGRLPKNSLALSELKAVVLAKRLEFLKDKSRRGNPTLALELIKTSIALAQTLNQNGHPEDALPLIDDALANLRGRPLMKTDAEMHAVLLRDRGIYLGAIGKYEDAALMAEQGERILREAAEANPDRYRPARAASLVNFSNHLADLGRYEEALAAVELGEKIYSELTAARPDAYREDWAAALNNLGNRLRDVGRYDEALAKAEQSESIRRELAAARPDAHRAVWAMALNNLGGHLSAVGRYDEALANATQSEIIWQELAAARPAAYRDAWAAALSNLGNDLSAVGRYDEALAKSELAESIRSELAAARPAAHRTDWAGALENLSIRLSEVGRHEEALVKGEQAESIRRELATARPAAQSAVWARSLGNVSSCLIAIGNHGAALTAAERACAIYGELVAQRPGHHGLAVELGWIRTISAEALILMARRDAAMEQAELALATFDTVKGMRPGEVAPRHAVVLAILALRPEHTDEARRDLARKAFELIEPFFPRRVRGLQREMKLVITALRKVGQAVPADILTLLDENGSR